MESITIDKERSSSAARPANKPVVTERIDLRIGGMTCPHCPPAVEKALKSVKGVISAQVNLANRLATVTYDRSAAKITDILNAGGRSATPWALRPFASPSRECTAVHASCGWSSP